MMYTLKDLTFILYNNRSVDGVVKNFFPKLNPLILKKIEIDLDRVKSKWKVDEKMVEVNINEFDINVEDVIVTKKDIESLTELVQGNIGKFSNDEKEFLTKRGISDNIIEKWSMLGLSNIKEKKDLEIIGATCHPTLKKFLNDGIESGGILIPLFENGLLANCSIRKINSHKSLKYSLTCPDVPVWGLSDIEYYEEEICICEGLFDMMALREMGKKSISCSSAMWSGLQLYKVIIKKPKSILIFSDNDYVGLKTSFVLKELFERHNIETKIFISKVAKDPAEHYFQKFGNIIDLVEIEVNDKLIENEKDESFNFIEYLKKRKY